MSWRELRALLGPARSWPVKAALAAVFAAALPACYYLYSHGWLLSFNEWIKAQGAAGVFAFAIVYVAIAVLLLAPSELLWVAAGVVFGAWGVPLVVVSALAASLIAFFLSRHVLRPKVKLLLAKRPLLRAIDAAIGSQSWQVAILVRLNALVPFNFQNYFFGATDIGLVPYAITTFFGIMPFAAMYVYLGIVGRSLAIEGGLGASNIALLLLSLLTTAALIYLVGRKTKQKLQEMGVPG
ncbi:MAG TPA: VTT domain-containing protein [Xanthobacteraceae bacterium]